MKLTRKVIAQSNRKLSKRSELNLGFIFLMAISSTICTLGFIMNSLSVIIGAMVISPLLYPVVFLGAATYERQRKGLIKAITSLAIGLIVAIIVSVIISLISITNHNRLEIVDRIHTGQSGYFFVAFFSGLGGAFALCWPVTIEAIAGIAISVALIPPVAMISIGIAQFDYPVLVRSSAIVIANLLGIYLGTLFVVTGIFHLSKDG